MQLPRYARLIATIAAATILLGSGAAWATVRHYAGTIQRIDAFPDGRGAPGPSEPITVLLVGSDSRAGLTDQQVRQLHTGWDVYGQRTDSMMLAHIGRDGSVSVVSLPRDSLAKIPAYTDAQGQQHDKSEQKLNSAYSYGGAPLLIQTVEQTTGVHIDHYLEVNFAGFVKLVDALGGVEVCAPAAIDDPPSGLQLPAGRSTLAGGQALAYVRAREFDPTADVGRMKRQQAFVASLVHKAASSDVLLDPLQANDVVNAVMASLHVDQTVDNDQVMSLTRRLSQVDPSKVTFRTVPIAGEKPMGAIGNVVVWDKAGSDAIFNALRDDTPIPDKPSVPAVEVAPAGVNVQLVGSGTTADAAYADMQTAGYAVLPPVAGDPATTTTIEYDPGYDVSLKTLQAALPGAQAVAVPGLGGTFRVTVGSDYDGLQQVAVKDASQPDAPRKASDDLCS